MNTRLKQFLAAENITQSQFADNIHVVRASVSHVLSGRNNPSYEFIKAVMARYPALNMEWLMFGQGKMYKDSSRAHLSDEEPASDLDDLFSENEEPALYKPSVPSSDQETRNVVPHEDSKNIQLSEIKDLIKPLQQSVKQRNVSKIIVLFDDGSFQEL